MKRNVMISVLMLPLFLAGCGTTKESVASSSAPESAKPSESLTSEPAKESSESEAPEPGSFVMEAEYTNLEGKQGAGYSGGSDGVDMIQKDRTGANASNGYWVGYLYKSGISVDFEFQSTAAVTGAELTLRLTCEIKDVTLTSANYTVQMNGVALKDWGTITLAGASNSDSTDYVRPFSNHKLKTKLDIKEGKNVLKLITTNSDPMGGTMYATAPMVDCVKITGYTGANLSYTPLTDNLDVFNE